MLLAAAASASCGDWLQHDDKSTAAPAVKSDTSFTGSVGAEHEAPCNGPYCTRVPEQPVSPAPAEMSFAPAKSALQVGLATLAGRARESRIAGETDAKSAKGFPALVYHPPRA
jgi:hypothetical protein